MNLTYEETSSYKTKKASQESHCGGIENDTSYPATGGEYAKTRILSCLKSYKLILDLINREGERKYG